MTNSASAAHRIARYAPLTGSILGMVLILGSIAFFFHTNTAKVVGATGGIVLFLGAVWYAANPFLKSTRRYLHLRAEVVRFIDLVKALNAAVVAGAAAHEVERARAGLHEAVDRIVAAAGKTQ